MKTFFGILFLFAILSCDRIPGFNNYALPPEHSSYSEKNKLLVERYTYPRDTCEIFDEKYRIVDAWLSHNFTNSSAKAVNLNYLVFFCTFKNLRTNEYFIDQTKGDVLSLFSNNLANNGFGFEGLGTKFSNFAVFLKDKKVENAPDTIKIFLKQGNKTKTLNFYKYSSLYK
jgi:hypothetical protein